VSKIHKCEICGELYHVLWRHLKAKHNITPEQYYLKLYVEEGVPPVCKICGGPVKFVDLTYGYRKYCSVVCRNKDRESRSLFTKRYIGKR
jgi:hypothetical protein